MKMNRRAAISAFFLSLFSFVFSSKAYSTMSKNTQAQFALKLFSAINQDGLKGNVIISPTSIFLALSLLYNGAKGTTQKQIKQLLIEKQGLDLDTFNRDNLKLQKILSKARGNNILSIANSLWVRYGIALKTSYVDSLGYSYGAQITNLDFSNPQSPVAINEWVARKTNNKITKIIDRLSGDQVMILINAIYFKGIWAKTFDSNLTQSQPFFLLNGQAKQVPLMSREGDYWYWENELLQLVSLPYDDQDLSLDIFLPKKNIDFTSFLGQFNLENWQRWSSQVGKRKGVVKIPRFKLEYQNTLNDVLNKLGMSSAFNANQADFSGLTNTKVYVSEVLHKTYLEVNEEGSEAAAVTSIGIKAMAMPASQEPFVFRADRPFVCILREKQTNSLIFIASIVEPG